MPRLPIGAAYTATNRIAGAQRRVNLYMEVAPPGGPVQDATLYPRPGLTPLSPCPSPAAGRCLYAATNGDLYAVVGQNLYFINQDFVWTQIQTLQTAGDTPVYIADNGKNAIVVDGSLLGYNVTLGTRTSMLITDPNFLGGNRVTFLNYFLLLNELNSPNFYSTEATTVIFNALFFGSLTQYPGVVTGLIASEASLWIFSKYKGEVWADAGTSPFAFQILSGIIIEYGCVGPYALGRMDANVYWVSQSPEGARMALRGINNASQRISTHAVEQAWLKYPNVSDCIVQTYQIRGHSFVLFHFPTADITWVFDEADGGSWHEEAFYDTNGVQHRTKDTFMAYAYGRNLSLDWQTGQLYQRDTANFSDNGVACVYINDFPHVIDQEDSRVTIWRVIADVFCGDGPGTPLPQTGNPWSLGFSSGFGPATLTEPPMITMYISHDRGSSFFAHSDVVMAGAYGYNTKPTYNRCGVGYDTVIRFQWSGPFETAMNAPFVVFEPHEADI